MSQVVKFYSGADELILVVHQFIRPDGTLGASGLPDPKMILFEGVEYFCN